MKSIRPRMIKFPEFLARSDELFRIIIRTAMRPLVGRPVD